MKCAGIIIVVAVMFQVKTLSAVEGIALGRGDRDNEVLTEDVTQNDPIIIGSNAAGLGKMGPGKWTIPQDQLLGGGSLPIVVHEGRVDIVAGGDGGTIDKPSGILDRAAFWVDASVPSSFDSSACIWHDVRDVGAVTPAYPYATKGAQSLHSPELRNQDGKPGVYFHGYGAGSSSDSTSGAYMRWQKPDGTDLEYTNIRHVFLVNTVVDSYGFLLGSRNKCFFHIGTWNAKLASRYWYVAADNGQDGTGVNSSRTILDGELIDTYNQPVLTGCHLLEVAFENNIYGTAGSFCEDRGYVTPGSAGRNRSGGDYINECVIFTCDLSEHDRLMVEQYLMQKWGLRNGNQLIAPTAYGDASIKLTNVDVGTTTANMSGDGLLELTNPGLVDAYTKKRESDWRLKPADGTILNRAIPVALSDGVEVSSVRTKAGDEISMKSGAAERIVKTGDSVIRVDRIPSETKALDINAGKLIVTSPVRSAVTDPRDGIIPNASFEQKRADQKKYNCPISLKNNTDSSWTGLGNGSDGADDVFIYSSEVTSRANWNLATAGVPDGACFLCIKKNCSAYTEVTLPTDGVYDFVFFASARNGYDGLHLDVAIDDAGGNPEILGRFRSWFSYGYRKVVFRTPFRKAGKYRLWFKSADLGVDSLACIDNLSLKYVAPDEEPTVCKVPNGDFDTGYVYSGKGGYELDTIVNGWTFEQASDGTLSAQVAHFLASSGQKNYYDVGTKFGYNILTFRDLPGSATTDPFEMTPGAYRLVADMSTAIVYHDKVQANQYTTTGKVRAALIADGAEVDLGTVSLSSRLQQKVEWPVSAILSDAKSVRLKLVHCSDKQCTVFVDNLRFEAGDLVTNGNFANSSTGWSLNGADMVDFDSWHKNYYGYKSYGANRYALRLVKTGTAQQELTFPTAGLYTLKFAYMARYNTSFSFNPDNAYNPVKAWLKDASGKVVPLGGEDSSLESAVTSNYVEHAYSFYVSAAGKYTLGLEGLNATGSDPNALVQGVSVRKKQGLETPMLSRDLYVTIARGAKLRLDFTGTNVVRTVRIPGRGEVQGIIDAKTCPGVIEGPGALYSRMVSGFAVTIR